MLHDADRRRVMRQQVWNNARKQRRYTKRNDLTVGQEQGCMERFQQEISKGHRMKAGGVLDLRRDASGELEAMSKPSFGSGEPV